MWCKMSMYRSYLLKNNFWAKKGNEKLPGNEKVFIKHDSEVGDVFIPARIKMKSTQYPRGMEGINNLFGIWPPEAVENFQGIYGSTGSLLNHLCNFEIAHLAETHAELNELLGHLFKRSFHHLGPVIQVFSKFHHGSGKGQGEKWVVVGLCIQHKGTSFLIL